MLGATNHASVAILVMVEGLTVRIEPGETYVADTFSGPAGNLKEVKVLDTTCKSLGSLRWDTSINAVISVSDDTPPSLATIQDAEAWDNIAHARIVSECLYSPSS